MKSNGSPCTLECRGMRRSWTIQSPECEDRGPYNHRNAKIVDHTITGVIIMMFSPYTFLTHRSPVIFRTSPHCTVRGYSKKIMPLKCSTLELIGEQNIRSRIYLDHKQDKQQQQQQQQRRRRQQPIELQNNQPQLKSSPSSKKRLSRDFKMFKC